MYGSYAHAGDETDSDEGFLIIENVPKGGLGYFTNKEETAYIHVTNDRIIYNEYEDKQDKTQYNKGIRTVIYSNDYFINILGQTVTSSPITLGRDCGFEYESKSDCWISKKEEISKTVKKENIKDEEWHRAS